MLEKTEQNLVLATKPKPFETAGDNDDQDMLALAVFALAQELVEKCSGLGGGGGGAVAATGGGGDGMSWAQFAGS